MLALLLVYGAATAVMVWTGVTMPEHRYLAAGLFMVGLLGMWRQFRRWRGNV